MYNCFRKKPRMVFLTNFRGPILLLVLLLSISLSARPIKLAGTYDLNGNDRSELLLLKGGGLQYVEIEDNGDHREIWYYHPDGDRSAAVVDAVLANINDDPNPELIAIISAPSIKTDKKVPWLVVFKWTEKLSTLPSCAARDLAATPHMPRWCQCCTS